MTTEPSNQRRWDDAAAGVYEVWYLTFNHPSTGQGFWLRFITEAPLPGAGHERRAELWFARFDPKQPARTFGFHRRFGWSAFAAQRDPFTVTIGNNRLGHDHSSGEVGGDGHTVSWDLRWDPADRELRLLPDLAYAGKIGATTVIGPNPRVPLSGTLVVDGEQLDFDRAPMGQTHLWGKKHVYSWCWAHCAEFPGAPDALLELLATRLRPGAPALVMGVLDLDGERHPLNQFRHVALNRASWSNGGIGFTLRSAFVKITGQLQCTPDQMITAPYLDPDGTRVFCANTEIGDAHLTVYKRAGLGWREHRKLESFGRAHFELGARERDRSVMREHVTVG